MPLVLSPEKKQEIFQFIRNAFSEFFQFDQLMTSSVNALIDQAAICDFDAGVFSNLTDSYIGAVELKTKEQKKVFDMMKYCLYSTALYLFSLNPVFQSGPVATAELLLENYPEFRNELLPFERPDNARELQHLVIWQKYLRLLMMLLPAKENKLVYLRVIERLEGLGMTYVTGTGQSKATSRRCTIYHRESGIPYKPVGPRQPKLKRASSAEHDQAAEKHSSKRTRKVKKVELTAAVSSSSTFSTSSISTTIKGPAETGGQDDLAKAVAWEESYCHGLNGSSDETLAVMDFDQFNLLLNEPYTGSFTEDMRPLF